MNAIAKKELKSYFLSPIGYVFVGVVLLLFGYYFYQVIRIGSSSYVPEVYGTMFIWSMMFLPILTMRSFSDEMKNHTDQGLLTAPVGVGAIVFGKFLAAFLVFAITMGLSLIPVVIISFFSSSLGWGTVFGTVLGSLLYGAAMVSIGVFISSLTQSQIVAAIATFGVSILLLVINQMSGLVTNTFFSNLLSWISFDTRYQPFTKGIFNLSSIVFFLSVVAVFVFLTARKLESKRWG
ncbi:ABC-2 family transporter protein [Caprobacter fermentans]|uniref:ABC transporter permease subunit n=1 Tax=Caproicibacter fermentans TaxID=2576756 RepID=A0A6N8HZ73_9FIRM|nr:ABC transporter permease [Caproicibacter fermentans]MVB10905.1 ABC-2 family transporter protein [Caproicibacter fermentans]OCN01607.1 ABC transporter [Clostridium sp. W14A]QNK39477.1 ABC transporter permease subunit [Caproicibacter fermentans]